MPTEVNAADVSRYQSTQPFPGGKLVGAMRAGWRLFVRDIQYRAKLTLLGYFWIALRPLLAAAPIVFVGRSFGLGGADVGVPYELRALTGLILFQLFWDAVYLPQWIMRRLRRVIAEANAPVRSALFAALGYAQFNFFCYVVVLIAGMTFFGIPPGEQAPLALIIMPVIAACGLAVGALLAPIGLIYLDLRYSLPLVSSVVIWTTPTFYAMPAEGILRTVNLWNPLTYLIEGPRALILGLPFDQWQPFALGVGVFLALLPISLKIYDRGMRIAMDAIL